MIKVTPERITPPEYYQSTDPMWSGVFVVCKIECNLCNKEWHAGIHIVKQLEELEHHETLKHHDCSAIAKRIATEAALALEQELQTLRARVNCLEQKFGKDEQKKLL